MRKLKKRVTEKIQNLIGEHKIVARSFAMGSFIRALLKRIPMSRQELKSKVFPANQ